jgi:hypothetical protein
VSRRLLADHTRARPSGGPREESPRLACTRIGRPMPGDIMAVAPDRPPVSVCRGRETKGGHE